MMDTETIRVYMYQVTFTAFGNQNVEILLNVQSGSAVCIVASTPKFMSFVDDLPEKRTLTTKHQG